MTIVKSRMCEHSGCEKRPSFGFRLENKKRFCFRHAEDDMINLLLKVCAHSGCTSTANYGHGRTRTHCQPHGERGMTGPKGQMIVSALQPSVWPEEASTTAAAGGVLDVAKAAFLAAAGSAGAGGKNGGDDDVGMAGDLPAVEQPSWVSERLQERERERKGERGNALCVCTCVYVCDLSQMRCANFPCKPRCPQDNKLCATSPRDVARVPNSSHRPRRRWSERENESRSKGGKQRT